MLQQRRPGDNTYTFSSQPRAIQQRKKYRDSFGQQSDGPPPYGNIMYDRRIVRGNTYAQHVLPVTAQQDPLDVQKQQDARKRAIARRKPKAQLKSATPEPVEGRRHIDIQTELYLEELTDRVEEADISTQTDAFLDRPSTPLYIPAKTGRDVATQILDGELFDFDVEVKPILEVLIGKTVEQALLEVMEEEELANLRAQQRQFEELRNAELVETQRLEEQERRHREEKERRMQQQLEVAIKEKETNEKIAARAFAQSYLTDLVPSVFGTLGENGFFYDNVERDVESMFMPWLMDEVENSLDQTRTARLLLDSMIKTVVATRHCDYTELEAEIQRHIDNRIKIQNQAAEKNETADENVTEKDQEDILKESLDVDSGPISQEEEDRSIVSEQDRDSDASDGEVLEDGIDQ